MSNALTTWTLALLSLSPWAAWAEPGSAKAEVTTGSEPGARVDREKRLRGRLGLFGGLAMQKTQFELGASYDVLALTPRLRLVGDVTVGLRANEVTLEPMVGVRLPFTIKDVLKLEPYVAALVGLNLTFMRGGTGVSVPLRGTVGLHYAVMPRLGVGAELSLEFGPLLAPFADGYAAAHFGAVAAWAL